MVKRYSITIIRYTIFLFILTYGSPDIMDIIKEILKAVIFNLTRWKVKYLCPYCNQEVTKSSEWVDIHDLDIEYAYICNNMKCQIYSYLIKKKALLQEHYENFNN